MNNVIIKFKKFNTSEEFEEWQLFASANVKINIIQFFPIALTFNATQDTKPFKYKMHSQSTSEYGVMVTYNETPYSQEKSKPKTTGDALQ